MGPAGMRAVVLRQHGEIADSLHLQEDFPRPRPGFREVLLRVRACALNHHDLLSLRGMPGIDIGLPRILGSDLSGDIHELGPGIEPGAWRVGEPVLVDPVDAANRLISGETRDGGLAEFATVHVDQLMRLPPAVACEQAAALPVAYGAAYRMLVTRGQVEGGERVLILGASGGVGTACVQLAKMLGAEVIACSSTADKLARLAGLGADHLIDTSTQDFQEVCAERFGRARVYDRASSGGVDVVINFIGGSTWLPSLRCLRRQGRLLVCGATAGFDPQQDLRPLFTFEHQVIGSNGWRRTDLTALLDFLAAGALEPVIDSVLPLHRAADGLRAMQRREIFGKVIVTPHRDG